MAKNDAAKNETEKVQEESKRAAAQREKAEATAKARKEAIDSGDLIVTKTHEYETSTKETKAQTQSKAVVELVKKSKDPVIFSDAAEKAGSKYPEDLLPAMFALEALGLVKRFNARSTADGASQRPQVSFLWIG